MTVIWGRRMDVTTPRTKKNLNQWIMDLITDKQLSSICYHLWQNHVEYTDGDMKKLEHLDRGTASQIINWFRTGKKELAIKQVKHLLT